MNWYVWSGNKNGRENGGPAKVVAVWKYVVDKFREAGADNVKWLWVPHGPSTDLSTEAWNQLSNYWPGDDYVDWITEAFTKIKTEYPRIKLFTWFHIKKELDWRVASSPEALEAFKEAMEDPYFIGNPDM